MNKALIIAAHPDDDILGCGGTISKYKNITNFKIVFIGEGTSCRFEDPNSQQAKDEISYRNNCAKKALSVLGVDKFSFYNLPCGRFDQVPLIEINKIIEKEIAVFNPDTVFTHSYTDTNKDHVKVYDSTIIATRPGANNIKNLYSYEVLSSSEWSFKESFSPNVFNSLTKQNLKEKLLSFKEYSTEIKDLPFPRSEEGILNLAQRRGLQSGSFYAEGFRLIRSIKK